MIRRPEIAQLETLYPLRGLKAGSLHGLVKQIELLDAKRGQQLFNKGDAEKRMVYLLSGTIVLKDGDEIVQTIEGGTEAASRPISPELPRRQTAIATNNVEYICIDSEFLDLTLTWDQTGTYEVNELTAGMGERNDDWMTTLLQIKAFQKIPPANIQSIFMRLQQVNFKANDIVIKQGQEADYFYVISRGRCKILRESPLKEEGIKLAELIAGDTFGEEALISGEKRNATIVMQTDGSLMRLGQNDFQDLLIEPMLEWLNHDEAGKVIAGGGQWLDVRLPAEYEDSHQNGSVNIPLCFLRLKLDMLDLETQYVVYCDTGRRSSAAAFILNQLNFRTFVLKGGLNHGDLSQIVH